MGSAFDIGNQYRKLASGDTQIRRRENSRGNRRFRTMPRLNLSATRRTRLIGEIVTAAQIVALCSLCTLLRS
jgi:hypothetical protein